MNFFRRTVIATAPVALGVLLFASGASATTITGFAHATGSITAFSAGSSSTVSASQFDQTALDAAIQAACPTGDTCSGSTLTEIDFALMVNLTASVTVSAGTGYVTAINGMLGTPGSAGSGTAIVATDTIDLTDPVSGGIDVTDIPTFSVATTNAFKNTNCTVTTGITSQHFQNCLAVASSGQTYSGTGTATGADSYTGDLSGETSTYVGSGLVTFTLASEGAETNGSVLNNGTVSYSSGVTALSNALVVTYDYSYTETSAPEPATMALVGGALLAIGIIRKKRIS
jgi:hypothetical protein